jgi:thymidylate synthase
MNDAWVNLALSVMRDGDRTAPRGEGTTEVRASLLAVDMTRPALTVAARRVGYRFMAAEAAWILDGDDRVDSIAEYAPSVRRFSDDGVKFFGAYGPKLVDQAAYVIDALRRDPATRQAVVNIWRESPPATRDVPCTLSMQLVVRRGKLDAFVSMRSSDVWLGVPYDVFTFSMVAAAILVESKIDARLGTLYNYAASRHVYDRDVPGVDAVLADPTPEFSYRPFDVREFSSEEEIRSHLWRLARRDREPEKTFFTESIDGEKGAR